LSYQYKSARIAIATHGGQKKKGGMSHYSKERNAMKAFRRIRATWNAGVCNEHKNYDRLRVAPKALIRHDEGIRY